MMYVAIWEDRHDNTTAHLFTEKQSAIDWAREGAKQCCQVSEDWREAWEDAPETETSRPLSCDAILDGFVYYVRYTCDGDCINVMELEPDSDLN